MVLAPVAGDAVQQDEPGIDLELVQIISPYSRITGNHYGDYACSAVSFCKVVPEEPQMPAAAGGRELNLHQQPIPGSLRAVRD